MGTATQLFPKSFGEQAQAVVLTTVPQEHHSVTLISRFLSKDEPHLVGVEIVGVVQVIHEQVNRTNLRYLEGAG